MKRLIMVGVAVIAVAAGGLAFSDDGSGKFREFLTGLKEAPQIVVTNATGTFEAEVSQDGTGINYVLTFTDLESDVRQAHIHLGYPQNAGNIVLWLCETSFNVSPVDSTPPCTQNDPTNMRSGRVEGTLTAADVIPQAQNSIVGAADWDAVVALIRSGRSYVNVHTQLVGAGEIRSQISNGDDADGTHGHQGGH
jgi:hypothetical protein